MTYQTYEFTGFKEADILGNNNGSSFGGRGEKFVMPNQATTSFSVQDNDAFLSGDSWRNEQANDRHGQSAIIEDCDGNVLQNCDRIYAERVIYLQGSDGKMYTMVEIEVEGGNAVGQGDDYFTFYNGGPDFRGTPPAGVTLTVVGTANVKTNYLDYKCFWQDDKLSNIAPEANNDRATVMENAAPSTVFNLLSNDIDADGDDLSIVNVNNQNVQFGQWFAGTNGGEFRISTDGNVEFRQGASGADFDSLKAGETATTSFEYTINDGNGGTDTATATVTITGKNDGPVATNDTGMTDEGVPVTLDVLANDFDVDGDTIDINSVTAPAGGQVDIVNGQLVYTPDAGFTGTDVFEYTITDEAGATSTAQVSVDVKEVVEPPIIGDGTYELCNHPDSINSSIGDGRAWGLRLDGLTTNDADDPFTFDFEDSRSKMYMTIDGDSIRIYGEVFGGLVENGAYDPGQSGVWKVDFTYSNIEQRAGDDDLVADSDEQGSNTGTITALFDAGGTSAGLFSAGDSFNFEDFAGKGNSTKPYTFELGDRTNGDGIRGFKGVAATGWFTQDGVNQKASDWLFTVKTDPIEPPTKGHIIGEECIHEGESESYRVKLDGIVTEDTYITVNIDNGTAKQSDGTYQLETIKNLSNPYTSNVELGEQGQLYTANSHDRNQAAQYWNGTHWFSGDLNQLPIGADNLMDDFEVAGAQGDKIVVKIEAGSDTSESFDISALKEIQLGKMFSKQAATEDTENFSLNIEKIGDITVNTGEKQIHIKDEYANYSPISFDLNGDGIQTLSIDQGVMFDMLITGTAVNTGWLSGEDGFLAIDNNGDGVISDRSELFGGGVGDGFAKLSTFDSNGDGFVNTGDAQFAELKLWQDANENGVTDQGELVSLESAGITDLNTAYKNVFSTDANGNIHGEVSTATQNGSTIEMTDVYFQVAV